MGLLLRRTARSVALAVLAAAPTRGEIVPPLDTPLSADRPAAVPTAETITRGRFQGEAGLAAGWGDLPSFGRLGDLFMRFGAGDRWELDLGFGAFRWQEGRANGTTDGSLGVKIRLRDAAERGRPAVSCRLSTTLPSGSRGNSGRRPGPAAALLAAWRFDPRLELRGSLALARRLDSGVRSDELAAGLLLERALDPRWRLFGEVLATGGDRHAAELAGGAAWLLFPDVRFDLRLSLGTGEAADYGAGVGLTVRW